MDFVRKGVGVGPVGKRDSDLYFGFDKEETVTDVFSDAETSNPPDTVAGGERRA